MKTKRQTSEKKIRKMIREMIQFHEVKSTSWSLTMSRDVPYMYRLSGKTFPEVGFDRTAKTINVRDGHRKGSITDISANNLKTLLRAKVDGNLPSDSMIEDFISKVQSIL